jgi:long-subunit acyl-CoA synthetase (AMP-forming)
MISALRAHAAARPEAVAFEDDAETLGFAAFARRAAGFGDAARDLPPTVGLLAGSSVAWAVADVGLWQTGRTVVPLPPFFSDAQLRHVIADAGVEAIVTDASGIDRARSFGVPVANLHAGEAEPVEGDMTGRRIVYTSGSTGQPKGVVLGPKQILNTAAAIVEAIGAGPSDRHLSVLPFSLLLEAVCGIYVPLLSGASCRIAAEVLTAPDTDIPRLLADAAAEAEPTTTVLVPQLLQAWTAAAAHGCLVPGSLRFVAVGGAAVPSALAERAWGLGIPVHEGYGLTECGSVVCVNLPGGRKAGTAGKPLPGYRVQTAADGEIVVFSDSVTDGYCGADPLPEQQGWKTGDIGSFDADGYLRVQGRKDNLIVTANGRNVSPEWIETMIGADPRIGRAIVMPDASGTLAVLIEPSPAGEAFFTSADNRDREALVTLLCDEAPAYAVPHRVSVAVPGALAAAGLLTPNGRPRRPQIAERYAASGVESLPKEELKHAIL